MNTKELIDLSFKYRKNIIFDINPSGYFIPNGNILLYSIFFGPPIQTVALNITSQIMLLAFNGERTLQEAFEYSFEHFENISKNEYFYDFMQVVNRLERSKILISKADEKYYNNIINNKRETLKHYQQFLENEY